MNSFPFRSEAPAQSLSRLASLLSVPAPAEDLEVRGIAPLTQAEPDQLGLLAHGSYVAALAGSRAGALLISEELAERLTDSRPRLVVEDPYHALATLLQTYFPEGAPEPRIHSTSVLGPGVVIGEDVRVGPYAVIESGAVIADGCLIGAHCVVGSGTRIGRNSVLHPHVVIYPGARIGERVQLHSGVRIGVDGFGYAYHGGRHHKVPHVGGCVIDDDVEIGANSTIDRGSIGETRVHEGAKLDNLVHLAHNVDLGPHAILAAQVGVAGSTRLGARVMAGGQAGLIGHLDIGEGVQIAAQTGVISDIEAGTTVMGFPARPSSEFLRATASQRRAAGLFQRVRRLEERVEALSPQ